MGVKFEFRKENHVANIYCDVCEKRIKQFTKGAVVVKSKEVGETSNEWWVVHKGFKGSCQWALEERFDPNYIGRPEPLPWWELDHFLKDILMSLEDIKVSGKALDGFKFDMPCIIERAK